MKLLITITLLLTFTQAFSQSSPEEAINRLFEHYDAQSPGVSVLITKEDTIIYKKSFGQANLEYEDPISSSTIFNAASLAKQFVAFGIYLLEKEGKLSFNDNVQDFIPEFPQYDHPIKISHLLTHTSGIRDQRGLLNLAGYRLDDFISNEDVLDLIISQKGVNFEPGSQFQYSHSNYSLLAHIIEVVTKMSLNEYMKATIFGPLQMDKTFFLDTVVKVVKGRAYAYEKIKESYQKVNLNYENYGPTNLMTTVGDLSKWVASLSNYSIAPQALLNAFNAVGKFNDGSDIIGADLGKEKIMACKGQFYRKYKGLSFYSHGGSLGGFRSFLGRFPDKKLSIIILGNENTLKTYSTALRIADILFELKAEPKKVTQANDPIAVDKVENHLTNQEQYIGEYFNKELNTYIQLTVIKGQLHITIGRNRKFDLIYLDTDKFKVNSAREIIIEWLSNEKNSTRGIKVTTLGVKEMIFEKVKN